MIATKKNRRFLKKSFIFSIIFLFLFSFSAVEGNNTEVLSGLIITTAAAEENPMLESAAKLMAEKAAMLIAQSAAKINGSTVTRPVTTPEKNYIVGYYGAWTAYSGFTPDKINASKLTHINYAFANIGDDLKIQLGYPDIDPANIKKLNNLKKANVNLKTLISVGGWTWSGKYSDAALTDASRTKFAESCVEFIVKYDLDGIDIDWEYPVSGGLSANKRRTDDKRNFTLLLQKIREKLDERGKQDGKHYLLSIAGGCGYDYVNNVELENIYKYIDYANIMTYDIHAVWDKYTDFCAPLYTNNKSPETKWSVSSAINLWLSTGFPAEKIVVGVPFYGYRYNKVNSMNNGLYQSHSGGTALSYDTIASSYLSNSNYKQYFDTASKVPWLFDGSTFISYDDARSIRAKGAYIRSKSLAGAAIWELSQDSKGTLLDALYNSLR